MFRKAVYYDESYEHESDFDEFEDSYNRQSMQLHTTHTAHKVPHNLTTTVALTTTTTTTTTNEDNSKTLSQR